MYSLLKSQTQTQVSIEFCDVDENALSSMLKVLSKFRNICAHNERLYNYKYTKQTITTTKIHVAMGLSKETFGKGKADLFAVMICLKYLLQVNEFTELMQSVERIIIQLSKETSQVQQLQLLKMMGFPENWKTLSDIDVKSISIKTYTN